METDLKQRTKSFALRIIRLYSALPKRGAAQILGTQVLKSGTSAGAHYREACRAKSDADFISKIEGALQELDETQYWLELIGEAKISFRRAPAISISGSRGVDSNPRDHRERRQDEGQTAQAMKRCSSFILPPSSFVRARLRLFSPSSSPDRLRGDV
jgi:four helix bundle protein